MSDLYESLMIWRRINAYTAMRYCCLRNLRTGQFGVQSADCFHIPVEHSERVEHDKRFVELFIDLAPSKRCDWFDTVERAISEFERDFS